MAGLLGVIVLALHGDRGTLYQDPYTYEASHTVLTPLGQAQEVALGSYLRSQYLTPGSPNFINSISPNLVKDRQVLVRADNGAEGNVILDSTVALLQGLFPPTSQSKTTLANGTTVLGPFGGYQYIAIESVEPEQSIQLEGWTQCPAFQEHVKAFYDSPQFKDKYEDVALFLEELKPYLYGIPNKLENAWNIFDFMNVNYIHNETYAYRLPPSFLEQARALANFHEHGVFTDPNGEGIGNVAGRTILPSIISSLERLANKRDPLVLVLEEITYKPMISLFNITGIDARHPDLRGIPDYGSVLAFELRNNEEGETFLRTKFRNGTSDDGFRTLNLFDRHDDIALNEFLYRLDLPAIDGVPQWCKACNQHSARQCATCAADIAYTSPPFMPQIAGGDSGKTCVSMFSAQNWPFLAIAASFMVVFGMVKLYKSRKASKQPRLPGYDPLPTTVHYVDFEPVTTKGFKQ